MARQARRVTTVGVITAERPAMLRRAVSALTSHCDTHGRRPRFLVVDGSRQPADQKATRVAVAEAARTTGHDLRYVGAVEARQFRGRLRKEGVAATQLAPGSAGANRNLLLLLTAGESILSTDDDMVCDTWVSHDRHDGVVVAGHEDSREAGFYATRSSAIGSVLRVQEDLIGAHERLMSTSIADLLARSPGGVDLRDACSHLQERLRAARPLDVRVTLTGLAGDSGTQCPGRLLFSSGPRRDLLWSNEAIFRTAMTYREVVRIARTSIITHRSHVMGFCMGLSNRKVMCPFPSVGRNEDGVFAVLLSASDPSALFGHVPLGVVHDSHRPSEYDVTSGARRHAGRLEGESRFRSLRSATESSISELVIAFLLTLVTGIRGTTPATRLREVGNELARLARLSPRAFVGLVRDSIDGLRTRQLEYGERATELPGCPPYWRRALIEYRAGFLDARARPEFFLPREFHGLGSLEAGFESLRRVIGEFGALVAEWPSLWKAARSLNASGSAN